VTGACGQDRNIALSDLEIFAMVAAEAMRDVYQRKNN